MLNLSLRAKYLRCDQLTTHKIHSAKNISTYKRSSLFVWNVSDEEKKFYDFENKRYLSIRLHGEQSTP